MLDHCDFAAANGQHQNFLTSRCSTPCCMSNNNLPTATVNYTTALISAPSSQTTTAKEDSDKNI